MEEGQFPMVMGFEDLCIYLGGELLANYQMPHVKKYDGTTCPWIHLHMYYNVMFQWGQNECILVQMFAQSLEKDVEMACKTR